MKPYAILSYILTVLALISCSGKSTQVVQPDTENSTAVSSTEEPAETPEPTNTPTPTTLPTLTLTPIGGSSLIMYSSLKEIFVTGSDFSSPESIYIETSDEGIVINPRWSPDGQYIAFIVATSENFSESLTFSAELRVMDTDGKNVRIIAEFEYPQVVGVEYAPYQYHYNLFFWSPDSKHIAYLNYLSHEDPTLWSHGVDFEINVVSVSGGEPVQLAGTTFAWDDHGFLFRPLAWSPNASRIAYSNYSPEKHGLFVIMADGTDETQLTESRFSHSISWHPGGKIILFIEDPFDGTVIPHPGGRSANPPNIPLSASAGFLMQISVVGENIEQLTTELVFEPSISPDGNSIAYIEEMNRVVVKSLDAEDDLVIGYACVYNNAQFNLSWSPDSQLIAFRSGDAPENGGCSFSADNYGGKVFTLYGGQIIFTPSRFGVFSFSPDSFRVLVANPLSQPAMFLGNLQDGSIQEIDAISAFSAQWRPTDN